MLDDPAVPPCVTDRVAARVLLIDDDGALLLLRGRDPAEPERGTWWMTPGGGLDAGETSEAAARRELREETGYEATDLGPVVFRRTEYFDFEGVHYRQAEEFFCVRGRRFVIDDAGWSDIERRSVLDHRWWTHAELVATTETLHPAELPDILAGLLDGETRRVSRIWGTGCGGGGPTYCALGRMSRLSAACSSTCVHQPIMRLAANVGVNSSRGMPHRSITMPA